MNDENAPLLEWDEAKRRATIDKHGIDFRDLGRFFDSAYLLAHARSDVEPRTLAIGELNGSVISRGVHRAEWTQAHHHGPKGKTI